MRHFAGHVSIATWAGCTLAAAAAGTVVPGAFGQSINIRFGTVTSTPSPSYGAAGLPGVWNTLQLTPINELEPLVSLAGTPIAAQYYQNGSSSLLTYDNPLTSGDDKSLMDSMLLSVNNPTDGCFWVQGMLHGTYEVTIYAMTPNNPSLLNRTRVDNATTGPVMVGGTWPGHQQEGVTYSRFTVTTNDGVIAFHDGLAGAVIQSGMNAAQFRYMSPCATPIFGTQPTSAIACHSGSAPFSVAATGTGPFTYQWQVQTSSGGTWQTMGNDPGPLPCGGGAFSYAAPINSPNVTIGLRPCPSATPGAAQHFQIRCVVSNACGPSTSNEATYTICPADFNCSGALNVQDIFDFLAAWFAGGSGADFNQVGGVNVQDIFDFLGAWFTGC
jgi:hypothetical protein